MGRKIVSTNNMVELAAVAEVAKTIAFNALAFSMLEMKGDMSEKYAKLQADAAEAISGSGDRKFARRSGPTYRSAAEAAIEDLFNWLSVDDEDEPEGVISRSFKSRPQTLSVRGSLNRKSPASMNVPDGLPE